eukprot:CAMPEP_0178733910 /NCGR_PEP_ID=MMETSP0744-20121128/1052_1 /TAXON_ID=913974 /ORGANISM="Nitzschia punctata, Strain CCMP561" /LENGTH=224 /DNA_ID=CAMNT_0020386135 /DNA_START=160 /DNA_END=834 /DNA_ORIENTATION=+
MATTTMPPPSLEEKLELLEARFTQPLSRFHPSNHSNLSEHSFSFSNGPTSASSSSSPRTSSTSTTTTTTTRLDLVSRAADKHIRKVVAAGTLSPSLTAANAHAAMLKNSHSNGSRSNHCNDNDNNSNSQQTLVTDNRHYDRVVAESPPMLVSPHGQQQHHLHHHQRQPTNQPKRNVVRTLLGNESDKDEANATIATSTTDSRGGASAVRAETPGVYFFYDLLGV